MNIEALLSSSPEKFELLCDHHPVVVLQLTLAVRCDPNKGHVFTLKQHLARRMKLWEGTRGEIHRPGLTLEDAREFHNFLSLPAPDRQSEVDYPPEGKPFTLGNSINVRLKLMCNNDYVPAIVKFFGHCETWQRQRLKLLGRGSRYAAFLNWYSGCLSMGSPVLVALDKHESICGVARLVFDDAFSTTLVMATSQALQDHEQELIEVFAREMMPFGCEYGRLEMRVPQSWQPAASALAKLEFARVMIGEMPGSKNDGTQEPEFMFIISPRKFCEQQEAKPEPGSPA